MKFLTAMLVILFSTLTFAQSINLDYEEEWLIDYYKRSVVAGQIPQMCISTVLSCEEQIKYVFQSLLELANDADLGSSQVDLEPNKSISNLSEQSLLILESILDQVRGLNLSTAQKIQYYLLKESLESPMDRLDIEALNELSNMLLTAPSQKGLCLYAGDINRILNFEKINPELCAPEKMALQMTPSKDELRDIFQFQPNLNEFSKGRYKDTVRLYMFCRKDRQYPCRFLMRDKDGNVVQNDKGEAWSQSSLGYSRKKKPYWKIDGDTPSGIFLMNGVMPEANKKMRYGKFRRIILNFVAKSEAEQKQKQLLPASSYDLPWWQQAVQSRNNGRSAFRIHGTGFTSTGQGKPYYPFMATRGCVAQIEGNFNSTKYKYQRRLLDQIMQARGYDPTYKNEYKVRGILYIININNEKRAVDYQDLESLL